MDSLMSQAVVKIKALGAEIIEVESITEPDVGRNSFQIMLFEYKDGLNAYFESLGPDAPIKSVEELIEFNKKDSIELQFYNQRYLELAQEKGGLEDPAYKEALSAMLKGAREEGIDRVMDEHGRKRNEIMVGLGYQPEIQERGDLLDGIEAVRDMLSRCRS